MDRQAVAVLGGTAQLVDVRDVEARLDALAEQIHGQGDYVDVARPLAIAEERALDAVRTGHHPELGGRHCAAPIVMRVQAQDDLLAILDVTVEPLDDIAIDVRRVHLDRGRQIKDELALDGRLDGVHDRFANLQREVGLGAGEAFGRILVTDLSARYLRFQVAAPACGVGRDLDDAGFAQTKDDASLELRRRVVEVNDGARRAAQTLERPLDELAAALGEHLDRHVVGDEILLDELADEVVVGLRRRRKADFDLLEADIQQHVPETPLALGVHRIDQRLIAIAQVDAAPQGRPLDARIRPGAVLQLQRQEGRVAVMRHRLRYDSRRRHPRNDAIPRGLTQSSVRTCRGEWSGWG